METLDCSMDNSDNDTVYPRRPTSHFLQMAAINVKVQPAAYFALKNEVVPAKVTLAVMNWERC